MRTSLASRRGVTLVEIAIVVALIGVLAGIGAGLLTDMIPTWRTRQAATSFQGAVNQARTLAISDGTQYRIMFTDMDTTPDDGGTNIGTYYVQKGDLASGSTDWDTLPVEMGSEHVFDGEGYVNLADGAEDSLPQVSIKDLDPDLVGDGVTGNTIMFSARGEIENASEDFYCDVDSDGTADGYICISFVNKRKAASGGSDTWTAIISRAGMCRLQHSDAATVGFSSGRASTTKSGGAATGYVGPNSDGRDTGGAIPM